MNAQWDGKTINHFGVSGGKDSTALLLWAVHESGYPLESLRVTFNNTHNEDEITYDYLRMLSERVHPIEWLEPELGFEALAVHKKRFPSALARFCTQDLKMKVAKKYAYELLDQGFDVVMHSGVRAAESPDRAKLPERDWDSYFGLPVYRPLLLWAIADIWAIHERYDIPRNPLYLPPYRMTRVGCFPCINSNKGEIYRINKYRPLAIDRVRDMEARVQAVNDRATFFYRNTVTANHRTKEITTKKGETLMVATIDDVVRWSKTSRGGASVLL